MRIRPWFTIACALSLIAGPTLAFAQSDRDIASGTSDGLVEVKSNRFDRVYLRPGADLRAYSKFMLDATQVSFAERWLGDMNHHPIAVLQGTTAVEAQQIAELMRFGLWNSFINVFKNAGYEIVTVPGASVLALSLRLTDLYINAPSTVTNALPSRVYTQNAGEATLVLEMRDSATGALVGSIVDRRLTNTRGSSLRSSVRIAGATTSYTNQFDFESMFGLWALYCIDELKAQPSVAMSVPTQRQ